MTGFAALLSDCGVQAEDLDKAQSYQQKYGGRLEQILVNMGSLSSEALPGIYSRLLQIDVLPSGAAQQWDPPETIDEFPLDLLVSRGWLPYHVEASGRCRFATRAPLDLDVNEWLRAAAVISTSCSSAKKPSAPCAGGSVGIKTCVLKPGSTRSRKGGCANSPPKRRPSICLIL